MTDPATDVHTHLAPDLASGPAPVPGVRTGPDSRYTVDGHRVGLPGLYDADALADWLRGNGIDEGWVSPPPPFYRQGLPEDEVGAWVRALNDGVFARVSGHPGLSVLGYLPLDAPGAALAELGRLRDRRRDAPAPLRGWAASAGGKSLPMDDERLRPVWAAIAGSGLPLLLHPGDSPDPRMDRHYLANLLGNPVETALAAAELIFGGVLARHDNLRVVLVHGGGAMPAVIGRWARGAETARPGIGDLLLPPRDAARRMWVDALAYEPAVIDLARTVLGEDRVVLGSDYPFPMGVNDPWSCVTHLCPAARERIGRGNAAALAGAR